jgi:pimeloyl-ACP methyl ester carboxylesterase
MDMRADTARSDGIGTDTSKVAAYVDAVGVRTYYEAEGVGDPLVLLHGGLCTIEAFGAQTAALAPHYRVVNPERRGHGRTPDVPGPITYDNMTGDTIAFLDAVDVRDAHLVGWSDGAVVALKVALRRPDLVGKLVLIGQGVNHDGDSPVAREMLALVMQDALTPQMLPPMLEQDVRSGVAGRAGALPGRVPQAHDGDQDAARHGAGRAPAGDRGDARAHR